MKKPIIFLIILSILVLLFIIFTQNKTNFETITEEMKYPIHKDITVTIFWIGESATEENNFVSNSVSSWDNNWEEHFGGIDYPNSRNGYFPADFTPKENPFYFALPYNDFDETGNKKENIEHIYWYDEIYSEEESLLKNKWIKITKDGKTAYAQWEDSGPFQYNDINYVFGTNNPKNKINNNAGLDVSPAVRDYLELYDIDKVDWQFVDFSEVPEGPWKQIVTTTQIDWI